MIRRRRLTQTPYNSTLGVGRFVLDRLEAHVPLAHSLRHDFL